MRREERHAVSRPARAEVGDGKVLQCRIANVSRSGALLLVPDGEGLPDIFHIVDTFANSRRQVRKVWTAHNRVGVQYVDGENGHFGKPAKKRATFGKRLKQD